MTSSPILGDVGGHFDDVGVVTRDPLCVVVHLAPGLGQVGLDARDVGGEGADVRPH